MNVCIIVIYRLMSHSNDIKFNQNLLSNSNSFMYYLLIFSISIRAETKSEFVHALSHFQ